MIQRLRPKALGVILRSNNEEKFVKQQCLEQKFKQNNGTVYPPFDAVSET